MLRTVSLLQMVQFNAKMFTTGKTQGVLLSLQNKKIQLSKVFSAMLAIHPNKPGTVNAFLCLLFKSPNLVHLEKQYNMLV